MSQSFHPTESSLQGTLVEHREAFETLVEHDDNEIAQLFGEVPLDMLAELEGDDE